MDLSEMRATRRRYYKKMDEKKARVRMLREAR
jgi:hypothetical protein